MAVVEEINQSPTAAIQYPMFGPYLEMQAHGIGGGGGTVINRFFVNRAWDTSLLKFVLWASTVTPDSTGVSYPHTWANATDFTAMEVCR